MYRLILAIILAVVGWLTVRYSVSVKDSGFVKISGPVTFSAPESARINFEDISAAQTYARKQNITTFDLTFLFEVPSSYCEKTIEPSLYLGRVYDFDRVFLNEKYIGSTGSQTSLLTRNFAKERLYHLPKEAFRCAEKNSFRIEISKKIPGRIGLIEGSILFGEYDSLRRLSDFRMFLKNDAPASAGLILLCIGGLLSIVFRRTRQQLIGRFGIFLVVSGLMSLQLAGAFADYMLTAYVNFIVTNVSVTWYLIMFTQFVISNFQYAKKNSKADVSFALIGAAISTYFILESDPTHVHKVYSGALGILLTSNILALGCYFFREKKKNLLRSTGLTIIVLGNFADISRYWELHSAPNITPWTLLIGTALFAYSLIDSIEKALESEKQRERISAIARTTQNLAHDVRKPFSMLKMLLEAISSTDDPNESKEIAKAALPEVNQAMASVEGMIQDVMQIGSNSKPNQEVASCEAMIDAAVNELFRIFPEADVGIEYDLAHKHCLLIDTLRVGRVFSNILVNAVQAMNGKGKLWIKTHEEKGFIEFRLGNAGSCIPKDSLPRLFDAFFTSGKKGGTGLGLAIAQKVVNEHGGSIRCESDQTENYPSGFVEFVFTLPIAAEMSPKREESLPNHSRVIHEQLQKLKKKDSNTANADELELERVLTKKLKGFQDSMPPILIVDDEAVYRNSLAGLLTNFRGGESAVAKIPLIFAKNADEALRLTKEHKPFLVIQDIDLGVGSKNGIDVIKELRKDGYKGRVTVHSNRFLFDDQKTATEAGADSVLPKPMSRAHLFKLIDSSLGAKSGPQAAAGLQVKNEKPRIAYLDDAITFTLSWKMKLKDKLDLETFSSTTQFFRKLREQPSFLQSLDVIVTDYYFGPDDPLNGVTFAAELRKLGYERPIYLASNGDFNAENLKPNLNGAIGKEVPEIETILDWLKA